jgi:hypothetical protein
MRAVRAFAASCTLLTASLIAHILAGGDSISFNGGALLVAASVAIAALLVRKGDDPIRATVAIFMAQNSGHFILGGQPDSSTFMLASHIAAGFLSYQALRYFDANLPLLGQFILSIFLPIVSYQLPHFSIELIKPRFSYRSLAPQYFSLTHSLRAPPSY